MTPLTQIHGYAHVAERYGLEEAIFLDAIMFWYRTNRGNDRNFYDGRWWTFNSVKAFCEIFSWWSSKQLRRIANSCREQGALLTGNYNKDRRDRTAWYSPSDELLTLYGLDGTGICDCPNGQMQSSEGASKSAQTGEPLPCSNHGDTDMKDPPIVPPEQPEAAGVRPALPAPALSSQRLPTGTVVGRSPMTSPGGDAPAPEGFEPEPKAVPKPRTRRSRTKKSVPTHAPERFEQFWAVYPGGGARLKAVEEWDALAPDDGLIDEMARALKRQMDSRLWREGVGIPHAWRWLRDRRWTDKLQETPRPREDSGGWSDYTGGGT